VTSDTTPQEPEGGLALAAAPGEKEKKSAWKLIATPVVLALLGLALLPVSLLLYPSSGQTSAPAFARLSVLTNERMTFITYAAVQVSPALARIEVEVVRGVSAAPITGTPFASLALSPPIGTTFPSCPELQGCKEIPGLVPAYLWTVPLVFNAVGAAYESFYVKASSLGVSDNGINALAAIPEVIYSGTGAPEFLAGYHIPLAASYDWSALPPAAFKGSIVAWTEQLEFNDTPAKVAVGINQSRQSNDNHLAFIAGALIGVAGGAVLSAIQKVLENAFA
jgi:hypothetical protein